MQDGGDQTCRVSKRARSLLYFAASCFTTVLRDLRQCRVHSAELIQKSARIKSFTLHAAVRNHVFLRPGLLVLCWEAVLPDTLIYTMDGLAYNNSHNNIRDNHINHSNYDDNNEDDNNNNTVRTWTLSHALVS